MSSTNLIILEPCTKHAKQWYRTADPSVEVAAQKAMAVCDSCSWRFVW